MNQQLYRSAVQQICWSPQKRAEIEEMLRHSAPAAGMETVSRQNRRTKTNQNQHRVTEGELMASKRVRRIMWIGLAAAVLATGGIIAGAAAYAKKHPHIRNITWENGISLNLTDQVSTEPFRRWTTNPDSWCILPSESGWFFRKTIEFPSEEGQWFNQNNVDALYYADRESGKSVPVCARPNCKHDGSEYCTATTKTYANSFMTWYDGYLYTVTTKYLHPEQRFYQPQTESGEDFAQGDCRQVLLRYSPDGTEITELAEFGNGIGIGWCTVHRGYIWCIVQRQEQGEEIENPITHNTSVFTSGGWQLWGYELATGRSAVIFDGMGKPDINHVNSAPSGLYGIGDYLYFARMNDDWSGPQGLCRISLLTGETTQGDEDVLIPGSHFVTLSRTHALRYDERKENNSVYNDYTVVNLETGEEKLILSAKVSGDLSDICGISVMDDRYLYAENGTNRATEEGFRKTITLMDTDGKPVKKVETDFISKSYEVREKTKEKSYTDYETLYYREFFSLIGSDGVNLYATYTVTGDEKLLEKEGKEKTNDMLYCPVDSLLNDDKPEWKLAYSMREEAADNAN